MEIKRKKLVKKTEENIVSKSTFRKRFDVFKVVLLVASVSLFILAFFARNYPYFPFDLVITRSVQSFHPFWFDFLMRLLTNSGFIVPQSIITGIICMVMFLLNQRKQAFLTIISSAGSPVLGLLIKTIVHRPRPNPMLIHQLEHFTKANSFPSGHVLSFIGFYGFLLFLVITELKPSPVRTAVITLLSSLVVLIGFSRIYVGAHWFSDVTGSYLVGVLWLYVMIYLYRRFQLHK